jgi:hypothetical protein
MHGKMSFKDDLILLLKPYYFVNILLSVSYLAAKKLPFVCNILFPTASPQCELDTVSRVNLQTLKVNMKCLVIKYIITESRKEVFLHISK